MNSNDYVKQKERALKRKLELIEYKGGKCEMCGYNKNIAALEFHHLDKSTKRFQLDSRHLSNTNMNEIKKESDKCILLCSNCHRELHNKELNKDNISNLLIELNKETETRNKQLYEEKKYTICPICGIKFNPSKGKIYCSEDCRKKANGMDLYPSKEEVYKKYNDLKSWQKVADYYSLTRKIIQGIRNR